MGWLASAGTSGWRTSFAYPSGSICCRNGGAYPASGGDRQFVIAFNRRVTIPAHVIVQDVEGESALLNRQSQRCFDLDEVGTAMWNALTTSASLQEAYQTLLARYDVAPDVLRRDLQQLVEQLLAAGLLELDGG